MGALLGGAIGLAIADGHRRGALLGRSRRPARRVPRRLPAAACCRTSAWCIGGRKGEWLEPARLISLFRASGPQRRYKILDTSVIIDGRIADLCDTGFIDGTLVIPQFVLKELQLVADSADSMKRNRGRRGLDILQKIQKMSGVEVTISDVDYPEVREVDLKLIELARTLQGKIVTNDFNLNKVAQLRGVDVLNINELANALKPVVLPGEIMKVFILKEGKEYNQGVAYLDDGTMVVVDNARKMISKTIDVVVTSVLQTTAGKMIFGRYIDPNLASQGSQGGRSRDAIARSSRRSVAPDSAGAGAHRRTRSASTPIAAAPPSDRASDARAFALHLASSPVAILRPFHWWRTVFWLIPAIAIYTIVLGHAVASARACSNRRGYFAHWCARTWSWLILATTGVRVQVRGLDRLEPGKTYVFVANHQSIYDIPVIFASLPYQLRIIAKDSLGSFPFLGLAPEPDRPPAGQPPQARSARRVQLGERADGEGLVADRVSRRHAECRRAASAPFKGGSLYPAVQAGLPIVPISVAGSRHVMRKGPAHDVSRRSRTCRSTIRFRRSPPTEPNIREVPRACTRRVARQIIAPVDGSKRRDRLNADDLELIVRAVASTTASASAAGT